MPFPIGDHIGGEIELGVTKDGNVIWYLDNGKAADVKSIKLSFQGHQGAEDNISVTPQKFEPSLTLQK